MAEDNDSDAPSLAQTIAEARESFAYQCETAGVPCGAYHFAAFNNAIAPLTLLLEQATRALYETARDNKEARDLLEELGGDPFAQDEQKSRELATDPGLVFVVMDSDGTPVDLSGSPAVTCELCGDPLEIVDAVAGQVRPHSCGRIR